LQLPLVEAELVQEPGMERPLHLDRLGRVAREEQDLVLARPARGQQREGARELAQVERVLHDVEAEGGLVEAAVGEAAHERMLEDTAVDGGDRRPELAGEAAAAHALSSYAGRGG